jgi:hypothetical protein
MLKNLAPLPMLALLSAPVYAAGGHDHGSHSKGDKGFYSHVDVKIHFDRIVDAEEASEEFDEAYTHSHMELGMRLNSKLSINANIKIEGEPAGHHHGHGHGEEEEEHHEEEEGEHHEEEAAATATDKLFDDHPLLIEQITVNFDDEHYSLYAGKFNPVVGFDYHNFPGMFGYQIIESYVIRERIGLGAKLKHDAGDFGRHTLNVSTFFADTTLSDSLLHARGNTSKEDGGISNTEDFQSFSVSLGGTDFYSLDNNIAEGLTYGLGYAKQAAGKGNAEDETRYSVSLGYTQKLTKDIEADVITEHMQINHLGGENGHDRSYTTVGLGLDYKSWNLGTTYTHINNDADEADEGHDGHIYQVSVGYTFSNGIGLSIGYKKSDEDNEEKERIGTLVSYSYNF